MRDDIASPSASRTIGHPDDPHVDVEVGDHLADQHQLLVVLLAEERPVRPDDLQQLEHHGQHAREMRRAARTFQFGAERAGVNSGPRTVGYIVGRGRREHDLDALGAQQLEVGVQGARVGVEILSAPNCSGLTKIDTTTTAPGTRLAARTSARCPSCSAPMVGTSITRRPVVPQRTGDRRRRRAGCV